MAKPVSLKSIEKQAFRIKFTDGLWEVLGGCFTLIFALAPVLSETMGDFWSSMIFLPFWIVGYWGILQLRRRIVTPRLGNVKFGAIRRKKVQAFSIIMAGTNLVLMALGILSFLSLSSSRGGESAGLSDLYPMFLGALIGLALVIAAWLLDYPRLFIYGALFLIAPPMGEYLSSHVGASHHGFPIVFGVISAVMILGGMLSFIKMINNYPPVKYEED